MPDRAADVSPQKFKWEMSVKRRIQMIARVLGFVGVSLAAALFCGSESAAQEDPELDGEGISIPTGEPDAPVPELAAVESLTAGLTPVDLRLWTPESYPVVLGFPSAEWHGSSSWAMEENNAQPTLFYSDFPALWTALEVVVGADNYDDDYYGFAVGFQPGDASNPSADYLLVDWKGGTQWFDFAEVGPTSCTPGSTAYEGLAVSSVFSVPTADELWGHVNFDTTCSDLGNGVAELARASTLGDTGWSLDSRNFFRLEYTPTELKVYVNGQPEIELSGNFAQGRWAFYSFGQPYPNALNINGHGAIPVAVLGSADFDVTWVDVTTLAFAGLEVNVRGNGAPQCSIEDVSGVDGVPDGFDDLVCQFSDDPTLWVPGDGVADLSGNWFPEYGGNPFEASDEISIVP
jgi:hypothetical protein